MDETGSMQTLHIGPANSCSSMAIAIESTKCIMFEVYI